MTGRHRAFAFELFEPTNKSIEWLAGKGVELTLGRRMWEPFRRFSEEEFVATARGHQGLMGAGGIRITAKMMDALPELRCISKFGIGVDTIDVDAATARGILVGNTPEESQVTTVCEHAIALMLALRKRLLDWTPEFMRKGGWRGLIHSTAMLGTTVGIVGLGRIGRGVAERLGGWGVRILACDPFVTEAPRGVTMTDLATLLTQSDTITLHATPTPENRKLIDAAAFARMKPEAILVNTGRGWLVDYPALRDALREQRIAGAALDVYDVEPPDPADPLFTMPNVIATPHVAAWTFEGIQNVGWHGARNLWAMLSGEGVADIVNPEARRVRARA
ncbi:MAG TPA: NAD(P)-dependent oxidoreductase [Bauldia sp.]|nr:NAD(P)-dependent oxidoreductase [Bauldia sp.]